MKWLDRFGLALTIITFALSVLAVFFGRELPSFHISDGRALLLGLVLYQVLMAAAATSIAMFFYTRFNSVAGGTLVAALVWSFVNVTVMQQIYGTNAWAETNIWPRLGGLVFVVTFYVIFVSKATDDYAQRNGMFFFAPTIRTWTRFTTVLYLIVFSLLFHALWIGLDSMSPEELRGLIPSASP